MPPSCQSSSATANTSSEDNSSIMSSTATISSSGGKMTTNKDRQAASKTSANQTGSAKTKPSYKHVPHSQKPAHLVAKRNARERRRVQAVNQAFYKLRKCVPIENRNKRVSKVKTLQRAIDYIRKLERILAEDDEAMALNHHQPVVSTTAPLSSSTIHQHGETSALKNCDQTQLADSRKSASKRAAAETSVKQRRGRKPNSAKAACLQQQQQQQQLPQQEPVQPVATQVAAAHHHELTSCVGYPLDELQKYPQMSSLATGTTGSHFDQFSVPHQQQPPIQQQPQYTGSVGCNQLHQYSSTESVLRESSACNISPIYHHHQYNHQSYHQDYPLQQQQQPYLSGGGYVGAADYLACGERGYPSSAGINDYSAASFYHQHQQPASTGFSPAESQPAAYSTVPVQRETDHNWPAAKPQQPLDSSTSSLPPSPPPELTPPSFLANSSGGGGGGDNSSTVVCRPVRPPVNCSTTTQAGSGATQVTSSPSSSISSVQQVNSGSDGGYLAYAATAATHLSSVAASSPAPFALNSTSTAAAYLLHPSRPQPAAPRAARLPHQADGIANSGSGQSVGRDNNSKLPNNEAAAQVTRTSHQHHNHNHHQHQQQHHNHQPMQQQQQPHVQVRHLLDGGGAAASLSANNNLHV